MTKHYGHNVARNDEHDANYCSDCDVWTESVCEDPDCEFCRDRPEKPSEERGKE